MTTISEHRAMGRRMRTSLVLAAALSAALLQAGCTPEETAAVLPGEGGARPVSTTPADPKESPSPAPTLTAAEVQAAIAEAERLRRQEARPDPAIPEEMAQQLKDQWGVEVLGVRRTSGGYMLDFRFRVVDAEKALPLFDTRVEPYVLAEHSQIKLPVPMAPKVGAFRTTNRGKNIKPDKTYYMIFGNPDSYLKRGEKVSVVIGDFRAEHLTVH